MLIVPLVVYATSKSKNKEGTNGKHVGCKGEEKRGKKTEITRKDELLEI